VSIYAVTIKATRQQHTTVDISSIGDRHACSGLELCSLPVCMPVCMPDDYKCRPILLLLLLLVVVAGLLVCGVAAVELMLHYFRV